MRFVTVGNGRDYEVPETWAEAEALITQAMKYSTERGGNLALQSACARTAYGMFGEVWLAADPTQALCYLMQKICQRKGAGLDR